MSQFLEALQHRVLVCDGAMGTVLYARGILANRCFDELNLSQPALIREIHREYVRAGAEILETNTFGANPIRLDTHGCSSRIEEINRAGATLAREAAAQCGIPVFVAGSMGPLGIRLEPWGPTALGEARELFRRQAQALLEGKVDLFVLETFSDLNEIHQGILAIREVSDLPIVAQMTLEDDGNSLLGTTPEDFTRQLDQWGADVVGVNCSVGPQVMLDSLERMRQVTERPLSAQPNAGKPRNVEGRALYLSSPEYMAGYARRFILAGARIVGGCCGTTPDHIRAISRAARAFCALPEVVAPAVTVAARRQVARVSTPEKSALAGRVCQGRFVRIVELAPPRGSDPSSVVSAARHMRQQGIDTVALADTLGGPRIGASYLATLLQNEVGVETILQFSCRDRNALSMQSELLGAHAVGLRNLVLVTGDPVSVGDYAETRTPYDVDSIGVTHLVEHLNGGLDMGGNSIGSATSFFIGIAANTMALAPERELRRFRYKVEAGAEFAVTRPAFDGLMVLDFLRQIEAFRIPIIAGIWPLISYRSAEFMQNEVPGISIPGEAMQRLKECSTPEAAVQEGISLAREFIEAIRPYVEGVQVAAPFGRIDVALQVLQGWD